MKLPGRSSRASVEKEVQSEVAFHLEMATRELMERGMTRQEARLEAERRFGDADSVSADCLRYGTERDRKVRRTEYLGELRQDAVFAIRQLVKARGFTAVAVITLALGIGATAAMFSALDAVVLRRLPFGDPDRIVAVYPLYDGDEGHVTPPEFFAFQKVNELEHVAAARLGGGVTLQLGEVPEMVDAAGVTADYFAVFGVRPELGRTFTAEEDVAGGPRVAILSHRFWVSRFHSDPTVLNRVLQLDGNPHTVVGIMPASFDFIKGSANIWTPLALGPEAARQFGAHYLAAFGLLRQGVSIEKAQAAVKVAEVLVAGQIENRKRPLSGYGIVLRRFSEDLIRNFRPLFLILFGAVGFVLLIACSNVANLLLARGTTRAREFALRTALGAAGGRLVRQMLTESLVLALLGATAGLAVAFALLRVIRGASPDGVPRLDRATIDWRVLAVTLLLGVGSSLLFGLVPALRALRLQIQQMLREGGRGATGARDRLRGALVGAQVALTLALLVGAGLLIRSAWMIRRVDPGFEPRGVYTARVLLPPVRYRGDTAITRTFTTILDQAKQLPGVASAALTSVVPLSPSSTRSSIIAEDQPNREKLEANMRISSTGFFATMKIPLLAGRDILPSDGPDATPVIVVSQALVRALWPGVPLQQVIGKRIIAILTRRSDIKSWEIIGVVGDLHAASLSQAPEPELHIPFEQTPAAFWPFLGQSLVVVLRNSRIDAPPQILKRPLERLVAQLDPALPLADSESMEGYLAQTLATARLVTLLLSLLGGIALVLAMVGIYGVVSYFVGQRTQEIGIRAALGGTPARIGGFIIGRGLLPVGVGLVAGIALSLATSTLLRSQLFGVTPRDPLTIASVSVFLVLVAVAAMYVPARRAIRVSPLTALSS